MNGKKTAYLFPRRQGEPPCRVCLVHGGPGALGSLGPVRRELGAKMGVVEALCAADSLEGQILELGALLREEAKASRAPLVLAGHSFGAMLGLLVAARFPGCVSRLIMISSGPLCEQDAKDIAAIRRSRLDPAGRETYDRLAQELFAQDAAPGERTPQGSKGSQPSQALGREEGAGRRDKGALMARLGALIRQADGFDLSPQALAPDAEALPCRFDLLDRVWPQMRAVRVAGGLLEAAGRLQAPVSVIHGDHDPHPAEGVRAPLAAILPDLRFFLLARCGHEPWLERYAREAFYAGLFGEIALAGPGS